MSKLPFELLLALRYLRPKRTFVSIITLISIAGVALGVAVLIIVISVMSGFDRDLRQKIIGFNAHLRITVPDSTMADYGRLMSIVSSNREVRGVAPYVLGPVLVQTEPANTNAQDVREAAPFVRGVDARHEADVSVLPSSIIDGTFDLSGDSVIVGSDFARQLDLNVGDRLEIYSPADLERMRRQRGSEAVLPNDYTVTGIFDVGYYDFDADVIVTSLENAQDLFNLDDRVHGLMVMLRDPYQADAARDALMKTLGARYSIATWMEENHTILSALAVEKNMMFYLLFFIVLVAALCILSAQITFVVQKTREIGMLKAIGATNLQISGIFLSQSAIIGILGVLAGFGLGIAAVAYRNEFLEFMRRATGWQLFPASIYQFAQLPAVLDAHDIGLICGCSFVICILGGVLPAMRAGRLKPVEALRYE